MIKKYLDKLSTRAKIFACVAIVILAAIIFDKLFLVPLYQSIREVNEELSLKKDLLEKYSSIISTKELYEKKWKELKVSYDSFEKQFFPCRTKDLAQAKIQGFVKNIARKNGIIISRSSARKGEIISESSHLMLVTANFEINDVDKIKKIQSLLYDIEYEIDKRILINDVKIRSTGFGISKGVYVSITLSAIAKLEVRND